MFDSWMTLCEFTMELARDEAFRRMEAPIAEMISAVTDEMLATVEEVA